MTFRERQVIGSTSLTPQEVQDAVQEMGDVYKGNAYHLLQRCVETRTSCRMCADAARALSQNGPSSQAHVTACTDAFRRRSCRNCNTFSNDLCKRLTGNEAPAWVQSALPCTDAVLTLVPGRS